MNKVVKVLLWSLGIVSGLILVFVVFNQFDSSPAPGIYTEKDLPSIDLEQSGFHLDPSNGYYMLWAMVEPPQTNITSPAVVSKYEEFLKKQLKKNEETYNEFNSYEFSRDKYRKIYRKSLEKIIGDIRLYNKNRRIYTDWSEEVLKIRTNLQNLPPEVQVFYDRYRMIIDSPNFKELITSKLYYAMPNLIPFMKAKVLYMLVNINRAMDGEWDKSVSNLLDVVDFARKSIASVTSLQMNLIFKSMMNDSYHAIADLMNRKECPKSVFELVYRRLTPLKYEEAGTRIPMINEYFFVSSNLSVLAKKGSSGNIFENAVSSLLFQKNRTNNYVFEYVKRFIEIESTPPYLWNEKITEYKPLTSSTFWWIRNAGGKIFLDMILTNALFDYSIVSRTHQVLAMNDLLKISAELHLKYDSSKPVAEQLENLDSYKTVDLCSGKPYKWNEKAGMLYSIGTDRTDNRGSFDPIRAEGSDPGVRVVLHKAEKLEK